MRITKQNDIHIIGIESNLSTENAGEFRRVLNELIETPGAKIILDFKDVTAIPSLCIGIIANTYRELQAKNGILKIVNLAKPLKEIFETVNLTKLIEVFDTTDDAIKSF